MPESPDPGPSAPGNIILGSVPYLNVQPMTWAIQKGLCGGKITLKSEVPRKLAEALARGEFDTAIVPVFEYFRHPDLYTYIRGPVIAARGRVQSVMLFSGSPLEQLDTVYLDASSLTSVNLFRVIVAEKKLHVKFLDTAEHPAPAVLEPGVGAVVIGDPAIQQLGRHAYELDLAWAWQQLTGLPFVFAAWLVPTGRNPVGLPALLNESLRMGIANLEQVAKDSAERFGVTVGFALQYFTTSIHYQLGDRELEGWREFGKLCVRHGLIERLPELREFSDTIRA